MAAELASAEDIAAFIASQPSLVAPLEAVASLELSDCWIGAGFVRNAVWDALHAGFDGLIIGDVDVVYFDSNHTVEDENTMEARLRDAMPNLDWSVKNQSRMHLRNGDAPYANTSDAMMHWPEVCTAIGARSCASNIELIAPFGVDDLVELRVRPTPAFGEKLDIYRKRLASKRWHERWPQLVVLDA
jgi:hypothetical protein